MTGRKIYLPYLFIMSLSILLLTACADLRTKTSKKNPDPDKARELLIQMGKAHGIESWKNIITYTVEFEDEFYGKIGNMAKPYPEARTKFELSYVPKTFDGQLKFASGEWLNKVWGIQAWKTYHPEEDGNVKFQKNKEAYFWVPTYQYFIEFPVRIQEATALAYAGEREMNGVQCEGIIASWNTVKPKRKMDQYLIWVEKKTGRIYKLEYTIREINSFVKGAAYFEEYRNYDGIWLPSKMPVESNLVKEGYLHEMRILNFTANIRNITDLQPDKNLSGYGDHKPD